MDFLPGFLGVFLLAMKLGTKLRELAIQSSVFEDEVKIIRLNLAQGATALKTAVKNLKTLHAEDIDPELGRYISKQEPLMKEGQKAISRMLKSICRKIQSIGAWWIVISMRRWKRIKPVIERLLCHMEFMSIIMLLLNGTLELNMLAKYMATHDIRDSPFQCRVKTLQRTMKDFRKRIKKLSEAERLREGQLPGKGSIFVNQRYMRESMDMLRTLTKKYTPPNEVFRMPQSPPVSTSTMSSFTSTSTSSPSGSSDSSPPPPISSSSKSSLSGPIHVPGSSPQSRSRHRLVGIASNFQHRSPSPAAIPRFDVPRQERRGSSFTIDSRYNEDVFSWYLETGDRTQPTSNVLSQINIKLPFNIISIYKAQKLDLPIEDLETDDPHEIHYVCSDQRQSNWDIVGKIIDVKFYPDFGARTKPKQLSLFVVNARLNPPVVLGHPFLKQSRRKNRIQ